MCIMQSCSRTWMSWPAAMHFHLLAAYTALGFRKDIRHGLCRFSFQLGRTQQKTDQVHDEYLFRNTETVTNRLKIQRLIMQIPTLPPFLTPMGMRNIEGTTKRRFCSVFSQLHPRTCSWISCLWWAVATINYYHSSGYPQLWFSLLCKLPGTNVVQFHGIIDKKQSFYKSLHVWSSSKVGKKLWKTNPTCNLLWKTWFLISLTTCIVRINLSFE